MFVSRGFGSRLRAARVLAFPFGCHLSAGVYLLPVLCTCKQNLINELHCVKQATCLESKLTGRDGRPSNRFEGNQDDEGQQFGWRKSGRCWYGMREMSFQLA